MNALLWMALAAALDISQDEFRSSLGTIRFQRAEAGEVTGFTISTDRTRNLRWEKR